MPFKCSYVYISAPHIGHWYTSLLADALARWREMNGNVVILVTGNDEHGMKIKRAATKQNIPVEQYCNSVASNSM